MGHEQRPGVDLEEIVGRSRHRLRRHESRREEDDSSKLQLASVLHERPAYEMVFRSLVSSYKKGQKVGKSSRKT
jgi:hypothetical protein